MSKNLIIVAVNKYSERFNDQEEHISSQRRVIISRGWRIIRSLVISIACFKRKEIDSPLRWNNNRIFKANREMRLELGIYLHDLVAKMAVWRDDAVFGPKR
jgi:hypothetical protein